MRRWYIFPSLGDRHWVPSNEAKHPTWDRGAPAPLVLSFALLLPLPGTGCGLTGLTGRAMLEIMKVIAAYEAKSRFSELLREAAAGEVFIITRNGQKMAELRACQSEKPLRIRGMMKSEIPPVPPDFNEPLDLFAEYQ